MNGLCNNYDNTSLACSDDAMWEPKQSFHALSPHGRPPLPLKKRRVRSFHPSHNMGNSAGLLFKKPQEKKAGIPTTIVIPSTTSLTPVTPDTDMIVRHAGSKKNKQDDLVGVKSVPQNLQHQVVVLTQDSNADGGSDDDDSSDEGDFVVIESGTLLPPPIALDLNPNVWDGSFTFFDCLKKKKQLWDLEDFLAAEVKHQTTKPTAAEDSFLPPNFMWSAP